MQHITALLYFGHIMIVGRCIVLQLCKAKLHHSVRIVTGYDIETRPDSLRTAQKTAD